MEPKIDMAVTNHYLSLENANFKVQNSIASKDLERVDSLIKKTLSKLNIKGTDIEEIKVENNQIKITCNTNREGEKRDFVYKLTQAEEKTIKVIKNHNLVFNKDELGNKINEIIKENQKTLYYYSSGGGGHRSAKEALMEKDLAIVLEEIKRISEQYLGDERLKNSAEFMKYAKQVGLVYEADVLHDFLGKIGKWSSKQWDDTQKSGDVTKLEKLASMQKLSDLFFGPIVFIATLRDLKKHHPETITSTQAMATPAILLAIKIYNVLYKPKGRQDVTLHLYMTDMPTDKAGHFFNSLKRLTEIGGKNYLILHAPEIIDGERWKILCGLPDGQIEQLTTAELPVRPAFIRAIEDYERDVEKPKVQIKLSGDLKATSLFNQVLTHQGKKDEKKFESESIKQPQVIDYTMAKDDKKYFLMLGSQPTKETIKGYVEGFINLARENPNQQYHFFPITGKFETEKDKIFYREICQMILKTENWPTNLHILPLTSQDAPQIVKFFVECDTITRSGGQTCMELIVAEEICKSHDLQPKRFIEEGPLWEKGNQEFLKDRLDKNPAEEDRVLDAEVKNFFGVVSLESKK